MAISVFNNFFINTIKPTKSQIKWLNWEKKQFCHWLNATATLATRNSAVSHQRDMVGLGD